MRPAVQQLEYFVAVAEEGQFTRAAQRLHVAQPSISAQIRQLERTLGTPLLHRGSGPVTMTDAGETLLPLARRVLADLTDITTEIDEVENLQRGHIAVGATPSLSATLLPSVLGRFHKLHPGVSLTVFEQGSRHLVEGLNAGLLDLAMAVLPTDEARFERTVLAIEELVVVTSKSHWLSSRRRIGITDLDQVPMIMFRDGYDLRTMTLSAFSQARLAPLVAVEGGEMGSVVSLVAQGLGVAIIPSIVAIANPRLHVLRLRRPGLRREIALVTRRDRQPSHAAAVFSAEITGSLKERGWPGTAPPGLKLFLQN